MQPWIVPLLWAATGLAGDAPPPPGDPTAAILSAIELPVRAQSLRTDGVPAEEVAQALDAAVTRGIPAGETSEVLEVSHEAVKAHGNVDNFGDFVQSKLDEGLRGQDLAAAIRAEHEARGKGPPDHAGGDHGKPDGAGKPDDEHGKPDGAGKPDEEDDDDDDDEREGAGKPEGAHEPAGGPPEGKGKPETAPRGGQ